MMQTNTTYELMHCLSRKARSVGSSTLEDVVLIGSNQDSINLFMPFVLPAAGAEEFGFRFSRYCRES